MSDSLQSRLTAIRRRLHAEPELSGQEFRTADTLAAALASCAPDALIRNLGGTGLLAVFDSGQPGPAVLLRADFDALPIQECNTFAHRSQHPGVAHQCGHDGHSAVLLGVGHLLARQRPPQGKVCLLFQPAEETGSGARGVLEDPAFAEVRPDAVYAFHNLPGYPLGEVVVRSQAFTAAVKSVLITLQGKPAHAAEPEHGINPALAMAELLQWAAALSCNQPARDDFTLITPVFAHLGERAYGTAAGLGEVHFTLRTWTQERMRVLEQKLDACLATLQQQYGLVIQHTFIEEFQACENDPQAVELITRVARQAGMTVLEKATPFKWGEDFGLFTQRFRGALFGIGAGEEHPALHNADYDFPDAILSPTAQLFYRLALAATKPGL